MGLSRYQRLSFWVQKKSDSTPAQWIASISAGLGSAFSYRYLADIVMANVQVEGETKEALDITHTVIGSLILIFGMLYTKKNLYTSIEQDTRVLNAREKNQAQRIVEQENTLSQLVSIFKDTLTRIEGKNGPLAADLFDPIVILNKEENDFYAEEKNMVTLSRRTRFNRWLSATSGKQWLTSTSVGTGSAVGTYFLIETIVDQFNPDNASQIACKVINYTITTLIALTSTLITVKKYKEFDEWLYEKSHSTPTQWTASIAAGISSASGWHVFLAFVISQFDFDKPTRITLEVLNYVTASLIGLGSMILTRRNLYSDARNVLGKLQPRVEAHAERIQNQRKMLNDIATTLHKIAERAEFKEQELLKESISNIICQDTSLDINEEKIALIDSNNNFDSSESTLTLYERVRSYAMSPFAAPAQTLASIGIGAGFASGFYYIADIIIANIDISSSLETRLRISNNIITAIIFLVSAIDANRHLFTNRYEKTVKKLQPSLDKHASYINDHYETLINLVEALKTIINNMPGDNQDLIKSIDDTLRWQKSPDFINSPTVVADNNQENDAAVEMESTALAPDESLSSRENISLLANNNISSNNDERSKMRL